MTRDNTRIRVRGSLRCDAQAAARESDSDE